MNPFIIPKPQHLKINKGYFTLTDNFSVYFDPNIDCNYIKKFMIEKILPPTSFHYIETTNPNDSQICFLHNPKILKEGYNLEITNIKLSIQASSPSGHFYGLITYMQLLPTEIFNDIKPTTYSEWTAPCVTINDFPQFNWRGMHLDCSRHFFTVEEIKKYVYWMSLHKLNTFHWHLTDDQGWRFESKKYPKLTEIGSVRIEEDGSKYGPFYYTKEDMLEIVNYSKSLFITVVPEIEMPGHSTAALLAYPEFLCEIDANFDSIYKDYKIFCLSNEKTIQFFKDILSETIEIFDSEYIHIGGDEVISTYWQKCPKCQKFMAENGIENTSQYQLWFTNQISNFLKEKGRKMIGWDEVLNENLPLDNSIMVWQSEEQIESAVNLGHSVVLAPNQFLYFDHHQFIHYTKDPYSYFGFSCCTLRMVYEFNPFGMTNKKEKIMGIQACAWAEKMFDFKNVQWKVFPRLCALSETAWTNPEIKNYAEFKKGLKNVHLERLKKLNINYSHKDKPEEIKKSNFSFCDIC